MSSNEVGLGRCPANLLNLYQYHYPYNDGLILVSWGQDATFQRQGPFHFMV